MLSCASFLSNAETPNISDQYFEDIASPLSLNFDTYKGLSSVTLKVIDVDQDGLKDIVVHFWEPDRSQQRTGVTPNFLKVSYYGYSLSNGLLILRLDDLGFSYD